MHRLSYFVRPLPQAAYLSTSFLFEVHKRTLKRRPFLSDPQRLRSTGLNILLGLLVIIVALLAYSFITRTFIEPPVDTTKANVPPGVVIQIDLLNGCGESGAASKFTNYLRARGYDVVEMKNYKTFDVKESLVIDRSGSVETAKKVAYALGVHEKNIIQQINHDYFVDVSVVVGKDFSQLKPYQR
jgi:hypothetical protein